MKLTKSQLREIIREEISNIKLNENLITEGTRSQVGIIDKNGKVTSTYVHWDGYPSAMKPTLIKGFNNGAKVMQLLKTDGGTGISSLHPKIDGGGGHSFDNPVKGQTIFYGRDRGETGGSFVKADTTNPDWVRGYMRKAGSEGAEWVYLYDMRDNKWYHSKVTDRITNLVVL